MIFCLLKNDYRFFKLTLSFANCVEVIEPSSVRDEIKKKIHVTQEKYQTWLRMSSSALYNSPIKEGQNAKKHANEI